MEKKMMGSSLWVFGLVMLLLSANRVHAVTCFGAITTLIPCLPFLTSNGGSTPSAFCCQAVQTVNNEADTTEARRSLCECFKNSFKSYGVNAGQAKQLPQLCKITVPVPIDPSIDCSSIQ